MKLSVCLLVLTVVLSSHALSLTSEQKSKLKQHHTLCIEETNVDPLVVKKAKKGIFSDDHKLKEYSFCVLKRSDLVNDNGYLNEPVLMAKLPPNTNKVAAKVIVDLCKTQRGPDAADTAFQIYKCFYDATPNHVSLI